MDLPPELDMAGFAAAVASELKPVEADIRAATPVRTGRLQRSTTTKTEGDTVRVGWFAAHASAVEARRGIIRSQVAQATRLAVKAVGEYAAVVARRRGKKVKIL